MRSTEVLALVALAAVRQAAAWSGDWNQCQTLTTPQQADNECTDGQKQGLDLASANLPQGTCNSYQNFDLSGLSYGSFSGKSHFARTGGASDNCLKGQASKGQGPSLSCGSGIPSQKASIKSMHVSCDKDTEVQFVHSYTGSDQTCSYTKSLKAGTINPVDNTQCGGSTAVKCQLPYTSKEESCNVGFHSIAFDCTPGQQQSRSIPQSSPSPVPSSASNTPESKPTSQLNLPTSATSKSVTPPFPIPSGSLTVVQPKNTTTPLLLGTSVAPSAPLTSTPSGVTSSPSPPESLVAQVTSEIVYTTITSCPVTNTKTFGSTTSIEITTSISTVLITSTKTICTQCVAPPQKTSSVPASPASTLLAESQAGSSSAPALPTPPASSALALSASPVQSSSAPALPIPPASSALALSVSSVQSSSAPALPTPPASSALAASSAPAPPTPPASSAFTLPTSSHQSSSVPAAPVVLPSTLQTTQEIVTTAIVYTTLTTCPVTNTVTPTLGTPFQQVTSTISTIISTSISTVCTKCVAPIASTPAATPGSSIPGQEATSVVPPASSAPPVATSSPAILTSSIPPAPVTPDVLPKCVKTWVTVTKCRDNSDYNCYCQDDTFTQNVYECISSWEQDQAQQQAAISYYAGICAQHVPSHPAIITAVPSSISLVPQPSTRTISRSRTSYVTVGSSAPAPSAATLPPTTISISTAITLPCSAAGLANQITDGQVQASGSTAAGCTTTSLLQTAVTVPQVAFVTGAASSVGLQAGPAPAQAAATAPLAAAPVGAASFSGVAAGSNAAGVPKNTETPQPFTGAAGKAGPSSLVAVVFGALAMVLFA